LNNDEEFRLVAVAKISDSSPSARAPTETLEYVLGMKETQLEEAGFEILEWASYLEYEQEIRSMYEIMLWVGGNPP
jgi:hypothetical protein